MVCLYLHGLSGYTVHRLQNGWLKTELNHKALSVVMKFIQALTVTLTLKIPNHFFFVSFFFLHDAEVYDSAPPAGPEKGKWLRRHWTIPRHMERQDSDSDYILSTHLPLPTLLQLHYRGHNQTAMAGLLVRGKGGWLNSDHYMFSCKWKRQCPEHYKLPIYMMMSASWSLKQISV